MPVSVSLEPYQGRVPFFCCLGCRCMVPFSSCVLSDLPSHSWHSHFRKKQSSGFSILGKNMSKEWKRCPDFPFVFVVRLGVSGHCYCTTSICRHKFVSNAGTVRKPSINCPRIAVAPRLWPDTQNVPICPMLTCCHSSIFASFDFLQHFCHSI